MSKLEDFLTENDEQEIIEAIRTAEEKTSGEIRIHIEAHTEIDPFERALELFHLLKMDNTKLQNGVLIYLAVVDKTFVIYGDKGIHEKVGSTFWDSTKTIMQEHFKKGHFKEGLIAGVLSAGKELATYFPWHPQDNNELPNKISKA